MNMSVEKSLLGTLVDSLHEGGEDFLLQERVIDLGDQGIDASV